MRTHNVVAKTEVGLEEEVEAKLLVHEGQRSSMCVYISTGLSIVSVRWIGVTSMAYLDSDGVQKPFIHSANPRDFSDGKTTRKVLDCLCLKWQVVLSIGFVLHKNSLADPSGCKWGRADLIGTNLNKAKHVREPRPASV
jgi:hypothetical protein